jgi:hypothetical protein
MEKKERCIFQGKKKVGFPPWKKGPPIFPGGVLLEPAAIPMSLRSGPPPYGSARVLWPDLF